MPPKRTPWLYGVAGRNAKAIVAFLAPMLTQLAVDIGGKTVTWQEMRRNLTVALLTAMVTWAVPNQAKG